MIAIPDEGKLELLDRLFRAALAVDVPLDVRLYRNDYTPGDGSTLSSFTEATFTGYFRETIARATWDPSALDGHKGKITYATVFEWTNNGATAQTLYGYYIVNPATAKVNWSERFATPFELQPGAKLQLQPVVTDDYERA